MSGDVSSFTAVVDHTQAVKRRPRTGTVIPYRPACGTAVVLHSHALVHTVMTLSTAQLLVGLCECDSHVPRLNVMY